MPGRSPYAGAVTSTPRLLTLLAAGALALGLTGCAGAASSAPTASPSVSPSTAGSGAAEGAACEGDEGVTITVDSAALADGSSQSWCIVGDGELSVANALEFIGVDLEGTTEYGDQVICRVDGLPSASDPVGSTEDPSYVEKCESMPAAFAYWSLWVKPAGGAWDYAQEGVATLTAEPGDSVELLFTLDGAPATPDA